MAEIIMAAFLGTGGLIGLLFFLLRRSIDNRLSAAEKAAEARKSSQVERIKVDDELQHAYGRVLFWLVRFAQTNKANGELKAAFDELQTAEAHKKALDRAIIAQAEQIN